MRRLSIAALLLTLVVVLPAFAQDATPAVSTDPGNPAETDDVTLVVRGFFPSTDYAVTGSTVSRVDVPVGAAHGANEVELTTTIRYRYGPAGGQALTPYEARIPIGKFPRFTRIKVVTFLLCEAVPCSPWFGNNPSYTSYVYVRNPEPARLSAELVNPFTSQGLRVTMRFYHQAYHVTRTTHEIAGSVIRLHQDVVLVGAEFAPGAISEAAVTHDIEALPAGNYTIEWRQSTNGGSEQVIALAPVTVVGACPSCGTSGTNAPLGPASVAFDAFPLGVTAGTQTITLTPVRLPSAGFVAPSSSVHIDRIWSENGDYFLPHDCPAPSATLDDGKTCTVTVHFNPTLHGDSPGHLFVRWSHIYTPTFFSVVSIPLSGRGSTSRSINFIPRPVTPDTAVEYFAPSLKHYFFTSSPTEQAFIDAGMAGAWERTGVTFPIGGPTDVCRFYGDPAGPNSHFYTGSSVECQMLRSIDSATPPNHPAWRYEGIALKAEVPIGSVDIDPPPPPNRPWCRDENGRAPIYRLYNDGADKGIDSNHRHVPSRGTFPGSKTGEDIVRDMMSAGWIYEGNALCN